MLLSILTATARSETHVASTSREILTQALDDTGTMHLSQQSISQLQMVKLPPRMGKRKRMKKD